MKVQGFMAVLNDIGFGHVKTTSPKLSKVSADDVDKTPIFPTKSADDVDTTPIFLMIGTDAANISPRNVVRKH